MRSISLWQWNHAGTMLAIPSSHRLGATEPPFDGGGGYVERILLVDACTYMCQTLALPAADTLLQQVLGWSPTGNLLAVEGDFPKHCLVLYSAGGDVQERLHLDLVAGKAAQATQALPQQAWSANGQRCLFYSEYHRTGLVCDFSARRVQHIAVSTITSDWACPAWEPNSDRLLLCSQGHQVALRHRSGRCSQQVLPHSAEGGGVWTTRGVAICGIETLSFHSVPPGADSLQLLHVLTLQPGSVFYQPQAYVGSLEGALAASWTGSHLAALVAHKGSMRESEAFSLALVDWDAGMLPLHALGGLLTRAPCLARVRWACDGRAVCLAPLAQDPCAVVFRMLSGQD